MICADLVERVTDYLEGLVGAEEAQRINAHLTICDDCTAYILQMRLAIRATADLAHVAPGSTVEDSLLKIYREWLRTTG